MLDTQEQEEQRWEYWLSGHDFILNWLRGYLNQSPFKANHVTRRPSLKRLSGRLGIGSFAQKGGLRSIERPYWVLHFFPIQNYTSDTSSHVFSLCLNDTIFY